MKKEDHPRGLSPKDRKEWHRLCNRLLALYDSMPYGNTASKLVAGGDEKGNILMFFKGEEKDAHAIREFLG